MFFSSLRLDYALRGWIGFPYALVHNGDVIRLSRDEFGVLLRCDGQTDIDSIKSSAFHETLHSLEKKGFIEFAPNPEPIDRNQFYHHYDNRYIHDFYWSITGRCNYHCRHCYIDAPEASMGEMTHENAMRILDEIAQCGVYHLLISGGEPFVRNDFWSLIDHALEKGYFNGVSETKFAPDASMTRAMFVTVK